MFQFELLNCNVTKNTFGHIWNYLYHETQMKGEIEKKIFFLKTEISQHSKHHCKFCLNYLIYKLN